MIAQWMKHADAQYAAELNFVNIFPWKKQCKAPYIHFVAHAVRNGTPLLCGWLTLLVMEDEGSGFINEVSTRQTKDEFRRGVGQLLNNAVVQWAVTKGLKFLYLYPLNEEVRKVYMTPAWGYVQAHEKLPHLFRILSEPPSKNLLDKMVSERADQPQNDWDAMLEFLDELADEDETLRELYEKALPRLGDPTTKQAKELQFQLDGLRAMTDTMDVEEEEEEEDVEEEDEEESEIIQAAREILSEFLKKTGNRTGGKRKTRRRRRS